MQKIVVCGEGMDSLLGSHVKRAAGAFAVFLWLDPGLFENLCMCSL